MADGARALSSEAAIGDVVASPIAQPERSAPSAGAQRPIRLHPVATDEPAETAAITVAVVSPYPATRAGLRVLLDADAHLDVVAEAQSIALLADTSVATPAVIVVDPAGAIGASLAEIAAVGVVVLGPPPDGAAALAALGERAWGYLPPDADGAELAAAVLAVHAGLFVVHPTLAARVLGRGAAALPLSDEDDGPTEELTPRELEVLSLLSEGIPNKTIARRLGISDHTVKFHVGALLGKLGASSRTEAVRTGLRRGLIAL
jgi:DNA-binding NarL/FixJ family response regulator